MTKLIVGKSAPASFPLKVEIPTPNGPAEVNFTAKHMRATEFAKLREAHMPAGDAAVQALFDAARKDAEDAYAAQSKSAKKEKIAPDDAEAAEQAKEAAIVSLQKNVKDSEIARLVAKHSGALMAKVFTGWDLDEEFSEAALCDMCDMYTSASQEVFAAYNSAREGLRAKN